MKHFPLLVKQTPCSQSLNKSFIRDGYTHVNDFAHIFKLT